MNRGRLFVLVAASLLSLAGLVRAQQTDRPAPPAGEQAQDDAAREPSEDELRQLRLEAERARLEAERAQAEAARARAEAERAKAEAELLKARREKRRVMRSRRRYRRPAPPPRWAPPPPPSGPPPGAFTHDGFFMRFTLGPGFGGYTSTGHVRLADTGQVLTAPGDRGLIGGLGFSLGGSVGGGFIIHGDLWGAMQMGGTDYDQLEQVGLGVIGFGATYYLMPMNIYFTGSLGFATAMTTGGESHYYYDYDYGYYHRDTSQYLGTGVGILLGCGKEWWVSPNWGLGLAVNGYFVYSEGDDFVLRQAGLQIAFSATFN